MILPIFFWKFYLFWQISEKVLNIAFYTKVTPPSLFSIFLKCTFDEFVTLGHFRTGDCHPLLKINGCPVTRVTRAGTTPALRFLKVSLHELKFSCKTFQLSHWPNFYFDPPYSNTCFPWNTMRLKTNAQNCKFYCQKHVFFSKLEIFKVKSHLSTLWRV